MNDRRQLSVLGILVAVDAVSAFVTGAFFLDELIAFTNTPMPEMAAPPAVYGLANAGIVVVAYGAMGLAGYWFARRLGLPGIFSEDGDLRRWLWIPMALGSACGVALVVGDLVFARFNGYGRLPHPAFPVSILASLSAGIGEEIAFRGLFFGLWASILTWVLKRLDGRKAALWIANVIAALGFGAGHVPTAMLISGASSVAALGPALLAELLLLNGVAAVVAGDRYMKDGLVAASGVHFWADVVFHAMWGAMR